MDSVENSFTFQSPKPDAMGYDQMFCCCSIFSISQKCNYQNIVRNTSILNNDELMLFILYFHQCFNIIYLKYINNMRIIFAMLEFFNLYDGLFIIHGCLERTLTHHEWLFE